MAAVSVITPSLNQVAFLGRCIDSVVSQTDADFEFIVCDGGSNDGSIELLDSYGARLAWRSEPDGGQADAVNRGLGRTTGEIVGYLNSDDMLMPGALAAAVRVFEQNPGIDVVYGNAWIVGVDGQRLRRFPVQDFSRDVFIEHCFICQPAAFWRRSLHARFGYFDTKFDHVLDYEFWLRVMQGGAKFMHVPEDWACSREHPATKSNRLREDIFRQIRQAQIKHLGYCGRNWWEQELRYWRDESGSPMARLLPGKRDERLYRLAWWPYVFWRRKLGGPLFYKPGHWRA